MRALGRGLISRPLCALALGAALGIAACRLPFSASEPYPRLLIPLLLAAGLWLVWKGKWLPAAALLLGAGGLLGLWRGRELAEQLQREEPIHLPAVRAEAVVDEDLGEREEFGRRALLLRELRYEDLTRPPDVPRSWPGKVRLVFPDMPGQAPFLPGDRVRFFGGLRSPEPPTNPGEFDYRRHLLGRGITGSAWLRPKSQVERLEAGGPSARRLASRARGELARGLALFLEPRAASLARGIVLGDTGGLRREDMSAYARTGLVHILSVSGMHLGLLLLSLRWLASWLRLPRRLRAWIGLAAGLSYAYICGLPLPCLRALSLFVPLLLAEAWDLESDAPSSLSFGALLILLGQPGALFEAGFQLSFCCSLSLLLFTPRLQQALAWLKPAWLRAALAASLAAEFAALPLVAWHFSLVSWPSIFATALTAPLMAPIVALGLLTAILGAALPWLAPLAAYPLEALLGVLDWATQLLAGLPHAAVSVGRPPRWWLALWLWWGAEAMDRIRLRIAALPLLAMLFWPASPWAHRHPGLTKVWFLDVGQGDSILVEFGDGKTLLVDAGPYRPDAGAWVVGPALRRLAINRIDWAVATHPHADHVGGLVWVLKEFETGLLVHSGQRHRSEVWPQVLQQARRSLDLKREDPPREWQGRVEVLLPREPELRGTDHDLHNNNVALRVEGWLLLPGDAHGRGERRLLRPARLLKAGHHGSRSSSTAAFLRSVRPSDVVIQCGRGNLYRHPSPEALKRLRKAGVRLWRTDLQGAIEALWREGRLELRPWRPAAAEQLWQAPPKRRRSIWKRLEQEGRIPPLPQPAEGEAEL